MRSNQKQYTMMNQLLPRVNASDVVVGQMEDLHTVVPAHKQTNNISMTNIMCFSVFVFVCLFVNVFELTRVNTYTEITYVLSTTMNEY